MFEVIYHEICIYFKTRQTTILLSKHGVNYFVNDISLYVGLSYFFVPKSLFSRFFFTGILILSRTQEVRRLRKIPLGHNIPLAKICQSQFDLDVKILRLLAYQVLELSQNLL